jgi:subtilase family serine protease
MDNNASLASPLWYAITADVGSVTVTPVSVVPEAVANPTYADVTVDISFTLGIDNYNIHVRAPLA